MSDDGMTGARADAVELLTEQHREFEQRWRRLEEAHAVGDGVQETLARDLIASISQHDALETQFLYPALRDTGDRGRELADHSLEEHQKVRELLKQADGQDPREPEVFQTLSEALQAVFHHADEEEREMFPLIRGLGEERVMELGDKMQQARKLAPTHPHPTTPNNKVGATVAGAVAGVADKVRDAVKRD